MACYGVPSKRLLAEHARLAFAIQKYLERDGVAELERQSLSAF